jgi:peptidoglycan/LPS O-acetylase OafA/YrhL
MFRKDINGLRALAVIAVVIFHFKPTWMEGGFAGVDVFSLFRVF